MFIHTRVYYRQESTANGSAQTIVYIRSWTFTSAGILMPSADEIGHGAAPLNPTGAVELAFSFDC